MKHHVLLTGVTGFVGKVVLWQLLKRKEELGIGRISVLVRSKGGSIQRGPVKNGPVKSGPVKAGSAKGAAKKVSSSTQSPAERFTSKVAGSEIFRSLPEGWRNLVHVVSADLEQPDLAMAASDRQALEADVTHILHCAASVEFDLPIKAALGANVEAALHMLELARGCSRLVAMVSVSTAYVSVWRNGPIGETLGHLPRPADELRRAILDGSRSEAELLGESGHPNTYTYTKCVAEHLLSARRADVPLVIVRPSIISAAWSTPHPGWIDSTAAFAGCLLYTGLGLIKAWEADPNVRLDVVPVDVVAERVISAGFQERLPAPGEPTPIRLAAMGLTQAMRADFSTRATARFFEDHPGAKAPPGVFIGGVQHGFLHQDLLRRALPVRLLRTYFTLTRKGAQARQIEKINSRVQQMNAAFRYFIHNSFDFRPSMPVVLPGFSAPRYIDIVNRGMYKHLLGRDETELPLAGAGHDDAQNDLRWAFKRPATSPVIRTLGVAMRKALRRCTTSVTFDRSSFERAVAAVPPGHLLVLAPSHRSYFDFLLSSYVCFQHPELGIPVPRIAAAEEFSRLPVVSRILSRAGAFYVRRGVGKAVPELGQELDRIVKESGALMFFIEGQRSRGRRVLAPKRGLLRALQATDRPFAVLPLAIAYERVPEESAFERELRGGARSAMSLEAIVRWLVALGRGEVKLGRVHIACGNPLILDRASDVQSLARQVAAEMQRETVVTSFHLRAFLAHAFPQAGVDTMPNDRALNGRAPDSRIEQRVEGLDEAWLKQAIERRGGRVLASDTPLPAAPTPALLQSLQSQWMHWFYADALQLFPDSRVVRDHVARHSWAASTGAADISDARVRCVVRALFQPVLQAYELVTQHVSESAPAFGATGPVLMARNHPAAYLPLLEDAFRALSEHGMLRELRPGQYVPSSEIDAGFFALHDPSPRAAGQGVRYGA
ncbi:MAG: SDR family oxidoreductase [Deltaproteobacteria bacterium]